MFIKFKELAKDWAEDTNKKYSNENTRVSKSLTMCKQCYTFYYKHSWHFERPGLLESSSETTVPVKFTQCPVCVEQENSLFEDAGFAFR